MLPAKWELPASAAAGSYMVESQAAKKKVIAFKTALLALITRLICPSYLSIYPCGTLRGMLQADAKKDAKTSFEDQIYGSVFRETMPDIRPG